MHDYGVHYMHVVVLTLSISQMGADILDL